METLKKTVKYKDEWQLQEAKNRLSRVVDAARCGRPQTITLRGTPTAVVLSFEQYQELTRPRTPLSDFFRHSPLCNVELDLERSHDVGREVEL